MGQRFIAWDDDTGLPAEVDAGLAAIYAEQVRLYFEANPPIIALTQAQYDALSPPVPGQTYAIIPV